MCSDVNMYYTGGLGRSSSDPPVDIPVIGGDKEDEEKEKEEETEPPPVKKQPLPPPFIVGEGLPVVPPKLVAKINRGEFVDKAELLRDNIEADRRRAATAGSVEATILASAKPIRRKVSDLLSWIQCFGMYACVLGESYPELRQGLWAYQIFIMREACRRGRGWQDYDSMFRQQQASVKDLKWESVNNALYAVTIAVPLPVGHERNHPKGSTICKWCLESDHQSQDCALLLGQPQAQVERSQRNAPEGPRQAHPTNRQATSPRSCYGWNAGNCRFGAECRFSHICSVRGCGGAHRASEC